MKKLSELTFPLTINRVLEDRVEELTFDKVGKKFNYKSLWINFNFESIIYTETNTITGKDLMSYYKRLFTNSGFKEGSFDRDVKSKILNFVFNKEIEFRIRKYREYRDIYWLTDDENNPHYPYVDISNRRK